MQRRVRRNVSADPPGGVKVHEWALEVFATRHVKETQPVDAYADEGHKVPDVVVGVHAPLTLLKKLGTEYTSVLVSAGLPSAL